MGIRSIRTALLAGFAAIMLCGCEGPAPETAALATGYWQASISLPGGDIETGLEISRTGDTYQASLMNGQERVRISQVTFIDGVLELKFPAFNSSIRAVLTDGALSGELTLVELFGDTQVMPFHATPGNDGCLEDSVTPNHDLSGRWAVRFHNPDNSDSASIGEFAQRGSRLYGTFLNPDGDHRFLAGHVIGDEFHLSTFDGARALMFSGRINPAGRIENADFWSGMTKHQKWSAERNDDVELPDAFARTFLKPGYDRLEFEFPNDEGVMLTLDDEKFRDKVVLVTIAGTWCPNCNDEARFLTPFYEKYHDQGLEIVTLMFEHFADADLAAEQVRHFREKFDIQYDTLIAGLSDRAEAGKTLPALNGVLAYPTTIFIDRNGRVREIHTGFSGPGTGEFFTLLQTRFTDLITTLLAEPPNLIESRTTDETGDEI
jgi:peroxiredoxin